MTPATFPLTFAKLSDRRAQDLEKAFAKMDAYEAEGVLLKSELADVKYYVSNALEDAWRKTVSEQYTRNGQWEKLTEEERKLEQSICIPYPHLVAGYLKRAQAATKAAGPMRDDMIAFLTEFLPLSQRLERLKDIIGKRAPKPTKTSIALAERDAKAMTCQCCARKILAETGKIAHHGYQRPQGWGYQTASCEGALELPFEADRAALGAMIVRLTAYRDAQQDSLNRAEAETRDLTYRWKDKSTKTNAWDKATERTERVNRANFDETLARIKDLREYHSYGETFDKFKATTISTLSGEIAMVTREITAQQARYDGWKQTHAWREGAWAAL